jgi:hypothetical protein
MRALLSGIILAALAGAGCAGHQPPPPANSSVLRSGGPQLIVTPETAPVGRVVKVNPAERFVVLNYPLGHLPALDTRLSLYRRGLKVGEIRVVGPQYDDNIVADVVAGEAAPGDEAVNR